MADICGAGSGLGGYYGTEGVNGSVKNVQRQSHSGGQSGKGAGASTQRIVRDKDGMLGW